MTTAVIINSDGLGKGDEELGKKLMGNFLRKIWASNKKPDAIIFYNAGVMLLAEGSPVLDVVESLNKAGVDLLACGTCVGVFDLEDKIRVGRISNMQEIVRTLMNAESVITM